MRIDQRLWLRKNAHTPKIINILNCAFGKRVLKSKQNQLKGGFCLDF